MTSRYRAGADLERDARDALLAGGAALVVRSAGSKGIVDLVAFYAFEDIMLPRIEFVQAKRDGHISKADRWTLIELAHQCGAVPVLAKQGPRGTPVVFEVLEPAEKAA